MKLTCLILLLIGLVACGEAESESPVMQAFNETVPAKIDVATAAKLKDRPDVVLIDVREQWEYDEGHIPGVILIPMGEIESRISEIPTDQTVILTCRSGNRSGQVYDYLSQQGYNNVHNMEGGILAWQAAGFEVEQ